MLGIETTGHSPDFDGFFLPPDLVHFSFYYELRAFQKTSVKSSFLDNGRGFLSAITGNTKKVFRAMSMT